MFVQDCLIGGGLGATGLLPSGRQSCMSISEIKSMASLVAPSPPNAGASGDAITKNTLFTLKQVGFSKLAFM